MMCRGVCLEPLGGVEPPQKTFVASMPKSLGRGIVSLQHGISRLYRPDTGRCINLRDGFAPSESILRAAFLSLLLTESNRLDLFGKSSLALLAKFIKLAEEVRFELTNPLLGQTVFKTVLLADAVTLPLFIQII